MHEIEDTFVPEWIKLPILAGMTLAAFGWLVYIVSGIFS